jgi:CheY-like chemotaxis protein
MNDTPGILIVDPDIAWLFTMLRLLNDMIPGVPTRVAEDPLDARALVSVWPLRFVLTEIQFKNPFDGLDVIKAAKARSPSIFVVAATIYTEPDPKPKEQAFAAGADYYFRKPFPLDSLEGIIRHVFYGEPLNIREQ